MLYFGNMRQSEMVRKLPSVLDELLIGAGVTARSVIFHEHGGPADSGVDLVSVLPGELGRLVIEFASTGRTAELLSAARHVRIRAQEMSGQPVVAAPYIGDRAREVLASEGVNFVDLSGNAKLTLDGLFLDVRGRQNKFPERGRPSSPFTPASSRISRCLLTQPQRWWHRFDLADATGLAGGQVSKTIRRLKEMELVKEREDRAIKAVEPWQLLDEWASEYPRFGNRVFRYGHLTGNGLDLMRKLTDQLGGTAIDHSFTGLASAYAMEQFTTFRLVSVYVKDVETAAEALSLRGDERGANVQLIEPRDPGVEFAAHDVNGLRCVSAVQTYLDLAGAGERSAEAAEHLRTYTLSKLFAGRSE